MRRLFPAYAYGPGPRAGCWWDETCEIAPRPALDGETRADVAVIGGGFTGLSAALHLADGGAAVVLLEAETLGWGASGRNGGFCCLGGGKIEDSALDRRFGRQGRLDWRATEKAAVERVAALLDRLGIDADTHSRGETMLAHRRRDVAGLEREARRVEENYGVRPQVIAGADLPGAGMAGPFHGALTVPLGFGLNPRKYLAGLAGAAERAGAVLHDASPVERIDREAGGLRLVTARGSVLAGQAILATNGYSSEDLPGWLAGRTMPAQSTVIVTRPLRAAELKAAGWTSGQMAYDTRNLLHYFRLMPDGRFLFGMRGGLMSSARAEARARAAVRRDFEAMFPAWAKVETPHAWSGLVCLARNRLPFVGPVPGVPGLWAGLCYHGNGVAMGSHAGALLADAVLGRDELHRPAALGGPLARFPLGRGRRALMPPLYAALRWADA